MPPEQTNLDERPFLDVERSLSGRVWRARPHDPATVRHHVQTLGLSEPLARALASRGVAPGEGDDYLQPTLRAQFPDPSAFADMDAAAIAIVDAIQAHARVHVFADYDVDGASSAALLIRWFRSMGQDLPVYVPDRLTEGYGPSPQAFDRLKATGADLVVTVDCGAAAETALAHAAAIGLEVVVIDHHLMRGPPPACRAVVNPNRADCPSGQGHLAAAGVVFVLLAALNREARRRGLFAARAEPDIRRWLDLAALGAICDVTALTGFNRALVSLGLQVMSGWNTPGLKALMQVAGSEPGQAEAYHAGFILGPRINAGGRVGRADLGVRLLSTDDPHEALSLARQLDELNTARREVEAEVLEAALRQAEQLGLDDEGVPAAVLAGDAWHPGVVGIVAGRLRERWRKPVIVIGLDAATGMGRGSGRSQPGLNLGRAVQRAYDEGLLLAGGGHAMAAGLTIEAGRLDAFRDRLQALMSDGTDAAELRRQDAVLIDALVEPGAVDRVLLDSFSRLAPFGPGNAEPGFALEGVRATDVRVLKNSHLACRLRGADGRTLRAMAWRSADTPAGQALMSGQAVHVAGRLKADDWQGRNGVQLEIEDVADPRRV